MPGRAKLLPALAMAIAFAFFAVSQRGELQYEGGSRRAIGLQQFVNESAKAPGVERPDGRCI